jgi:hypothetical protein
MVLHVYLGEKIHGIFFAFAVRASKKAQPVIKPHQNHILYGNRKGVISMRNLGKVSDFESALFARRMSEQLHTPFCRTYEAQNDIQKRRFTTAVRADNAENLTGIAF